VVSDKNSVLTRRFAAGVVSFVVRCPTTAIQDAVERLFVDILDASDLAPDHEIVVEESGTGLLSVTVVDGQSFRATRPNIALANLVSAVTRLALDEDPGRLHLHCAALSLDGRGVLISAQSETGKTTLTAALVQRGWTYVSDEAVALELESTSVFGFAKPLMIKPGGGELVPEIEKGRVSLEPGDTGWWHTPASSISDRIVSEVTPAAIVILHRHPDGSTDVPRPATPLHPADAVVALMEETMDAERFGPDGVVVLANLAARCKCVKLPVGPLEAATAALEELMGSPGEQYEVRVLERTIELDDQKWHDTPGVHALVIGERAVIHDTAVGTILALDEAGTAVWRALHGDAPAWWNDEIMNADGTQDFVAQLASLGLLAAGTITE
jgi:hypothetical protein